MASAGWGLDKPSLGLDRPNDLGFNRPNDLGLDRAWPDDLNWSQQAR